MSRYTHCLDFGRKSCLTSPRHKCEVYGIVFIEALACGYPW